MDLSSIADLSKKAEREAAAVAVKGAAGVATALAPAINNLLSVRNLLRESDCI